MDANCFDDDVDRGDQKGGIQGGAHHTAVYLGELCRYDRPSGPVNTPPERVPTNILVERGVECGPTLHTSAAPKIVPVANPTTGNSSTVLCGENVDVSLSSKLTTIATFCNVTD